MASAASPSATNPKMEDMCNHMALAYSSVGCAERMGTSNIPFSQILTEISSWSVVDSCELGTCSEMVFDNQASTKNRCGFLWCTCLDPTINWKVNGILLLILLRRKVLNGLFETAFDFQLTDATTDWNVEEGMSSKYEALLFETDATTSWNVGVDLSHLIWFFEVTSSHTDCCMKLMSWKWRSHAPTMWRRCMKLLLMK